MKLKLNTIPLSDMTSYQLRWGLVAAYLLHLFILGLYVFSVIEQVYHPADRLFWLHQGGDNVGYFAQARGLLSGSIQPNKYPLGFPILLLPFMVILQPTFQEDLLEPVSAFWGIVMFPIGQVLLAYIAGKMTKRRWLALVSVFIWTVLPLIFYIPLRVVASPEFAEIASSHLMWAQMLSDGPAALFTLLIVAVLLSGEKRHARWTVLLGALCGFLMLIRLTGVLTVIVVIIVLILQRRWRELVVVLPVTMVIFSPQMLYNWHFFGHPLTSGYQVLDQIPPRGLFHITYLTDVLTRVGLLPSLLLLIATFIGAGLGLTYLWQQNRVGAWIIGLSTAAYLALYSIYYYSWIGGFTRFLIPLYPLLAILAAAVVGFFYTYRVKE